MFNTERMKFIYLNTSKPELNDRHFTEDIVNWISLNWNIWSSLKLSLEFLSRSNWWFWFWQRLGVVQAIDFTNDDSVHWYTYVCKQIRSLVWMTVMKTLEMAWSKLIIYLDLTCVVSHQNTVIHLLQQHMHNQCFKAKNIDITFRVVNSA